MVHPGGLFDLPEAQFPVQPHCRLQIGVGFQIQPAVASGPGGGFHGLHQISAQSPALDRVGKVELLDLRAVWEAGKFPKAHAAQDLPFPIRQDEIAPLVRLFPVKPAETVQLRVKIGGAGNIQMVSLQIVLILEMLLMIYQII